MTHILICLIASLFVGGVVGLTAFHLLRAGDRYAPPGRHAPTAAGQPRARH